MYHRDPRCSGAEGVDDCGEGNFLCLGTYQPKIKQDTQPGTAAMSNSCRIA